MGIPVPDLRNQNSDMVIFNDSFEFLGWAYMDIFNTITEWVRSLSESKSSYLTHYQDLYCSNSIRLIAL